jgi:hypothetical protein
MLSSSAAAGIHNTIKILKVNKYLSNINNYFETIKPSRSRAAAGGLRNNVSSLRKKRPSGMDGAHQK